MVEKDYIDLKYKKLYGRVSLHSLYFLGSLISSGIKVNVMFSFIFLFGAWGLKLINDNQLLLSLLFTICTLAIFEIIIAKRLASIIKSKKELWEYGLEVTIYNYLQYLFVGIISFAVLFILFYNIYLFSLVIILGLLVSFLKYLEDKELRDIKGNGIPRYSANELSNSRVKGNKALGIIIPINVIAFSLYAIFNETKIEVGALKLMLVLMTFPMFYSLPMLIQNIIALFFKKGIDFKTYYINADGLDPEKGYPQSVYDSFDYSKKIKNWWSEKILRKKGVTSKRNLSNVPKKARIKTKDFTVEWAPMAYLDKNMKKIREKNVEKDKLMFQRVVTKVKRNIERYDDKISFELEYFSSLLKDEHEIGLYILNLTETPYDDISFSIKIRNKKTEILYVDTIVAFTGDLDVSIPAKTVYYYTLIVKGTDAKVDSEQLTRNQLELQVEILGG